MTVKSIIDVEVNDQAFSKFAALFKEYQDLLNKTPNAWGRVKKEIDGVSDGVEAVSGSTDEVVQGAKEIGASFHQNVILLHQHNDITNQIAKAQPRIRDGVKDQARSWHQMARDTKSFASNIVHATTSLLRWASITGVVSGLVGAGGLFGIDRLAISAGSQRRSSLGLGITPGEQSAFALNFGRVVNTDQVLGGVNEALTDPTKRVGLYGAGLTENDIRGKDAAQVSAALIPALKRLADQTPENMLGAVLRARHLDQFISAEDFQRLRNTPAGEIAGYGRQFQADAKGLDLTKQQQKAWQDLQVQLSRAGQEIERVFIVGLTPLTPALDRLSESFTKVISTFLGSDTIKTFLDTVSTSLDHFASYIGTPKFSHDVEEFVSDIGKLAAAVGQALHTVSGWLGWDKDKPGAIHPWSIPPGQPGSPENPIKPDGPIWSIKPSEEWDKFKKWLGGVIPSWGGPASNGAKPNTPTAPAPNWFTDEQLEAARKWLQTYHPPPPSPPKWQPFGVGDRNAPGYENITFRPLSSGITNALLASVEYQESRGRDVTNPVTGAAGYFGFMPATAAQYGVNVHDEGSSLNGARRYLSDLMGQFGSVEKALAAYNWGPENLKKDLAKYGNDWRRHLPQETERYIEQITGRLPRQGGAYGQNFKDRSVTVRIQNQTGGNANVSVNALST